MSIAATTSASTPTAAHPNPRMATAPSSTTTATTIQPARDGRNDVERRGRAAPRPAGSQGAATTRMLPRSSLTRSASVDRRAWVSGLRRMSDSPIGRGFRYMLGGQGGRDTQQSLDQLCFARPFCTRESDMTEKRPVVLYGASGFSGRLVAEFLREYKVPFIAAGRVAAKIEEVLDHVPGIGTADYEVVQVGHSVDELAELFAGAPGGLQYRRTVLPLRRNGRRGRPASGLPLPRHRRRDAVGAHGQARLGRALRRTRPSARAGHRLHVGDGGDRRAHRDRERAGDRHAGDPLDVQGQPLQRLDPDRLRTAGVRVDLPGRQRVPRPGRH